MHHEGAWVGRLAAISLALLLANIDVADDAAQTLATQRGVAIRDYLAQQKLSLDRLFLGRVFQQNVADAAVCLAEYYRTEKPVPAAELPRLRRNALP